MKPTTPIIVLFVVLLAAIVWLGVLAQRADAPEIMNLEQNTKTQNEFPKIDDTQDTSAETDFGTDAGMELPIPDQTSSDDVSGPSTGKAWADFELDSRSFDFLLDGVVAPVLRVKLGDSVSITLKSSGGLHDFVIDELNVVSKKVSLGESTTFTFTATERGEFEYYCSVGSHRAQGMFGKFIVE
jgi:plastocyanin